MFHLKNLSFTSSIMKEIFVLPSRSRVLVKLNCIAFGSTSSFCCLLKSLAIILYVFEIGII